MNTDRFICVHLRGVQRLIGGNLRLARLVYLRIKIKYRLESFRSTGTIAYFFPNKPPHPLPAEALTGSAS
jgi:hypothetical protein